MCHLPRVIVLSLARLPRPYTFALLHEQQASLPHAVEPVNQQPCGVVTLTSSRGWVCDALTLWLSRSDAAGILEVHYRDQSRGPY